MVVSNHDIYLNDMMPCNIEQVVENLLLLLHTLDILKSFGRVLIKTVVIIATVAFQKTSSIKELWIEFDNGKSSKLTQVHEIVSHLGQLTLIGLTFFHVLSGCDTTSSILGKGKITFWDTMISE